MARNINIEEIIKRTVERSFPSLGDHIVLIPSRFSEVSVAIADSSYSDNQSVGDGRKYFIAGFSKWGAEDIVAE